MGKGILQRLSNVEGFEWLGCSPESKVNCIYECSFPSPILS